MRVLIRTGLVLAAVAALAACGTATAQHTPPPVSHGHAARSSPGQPSRSHLTSRP